MYEDDAPTPMRGRARATQPAERWEIEGFNPDDPTNSALVLITADGTALTMPFDPDLLAACMTVARAWDGEFYDDEDPEEDDWVDPDEDEDDEEPEDGPLGGMSRLTGWHQVSAFWDNLSDDRRKRITIIVVALLILLVLVTQIW